MNNHLNTESSAPSHYVGVGASAGGLEALQDFFGHINTDTGAAFIVVQHLSPEFKSMMTELLSKYTEMPIYKATHGMLVERNSIYLIPPRKNMMIGSGKLTLSEQSTGTSFHTPINVFLHSLAEDQKHKSISVILSGTGSDGSNGIKAIKETGGLIIVQRPESAKFDGMPINAINTGFVDVQLCPEEMGDYIEKYINHPFISGETSPLKDMADNSSQTLSEIFALLKRHRPINFAHYKASTVARRIERRMGMNQLHTLESYLRLLLERPAEVEALGKELLIGVTRFFRDIEAFELLKKEILPHVLKQANENDQQIRVWVACCSSGEEAYSIAILLSEAIQEAKALTQVKIFATDIDPDAIAEASAGIYNADTMAEIDPERLKNNFDKKGDKYTIKKHLRQMVIFATHNLIEDAPFSNLDLVCCRNALIYFQHNIQKKVLSTLYFSLRKKGYLFLGSSETLGDLKPHFEAINDKYRLYCKTGNIKLPLGHAITHDQKRIGFTPEMNSIYPVIRPIKENNQFFLSSAQERLIQAYAPDCIILNEHFDAIHVYGNVQYYTRGITEGRISNNIKDIVIDDLSVAISTALHRAETTENDVYYKDVLIHEKNLQQAKLIDLSVFYVKANSRHKNSPHFFIVQFIETNQAHTLTANKIDFDAKQQARQRIMDLESELVKKQEHLQITVEELETTNEELQSANEELMSANEELQSTNEELQSVNEELYTINAEYQEKIGELTEANYYLDNVINSAEIGMVFLDEDLTIRKFTPKAQKHINLMDADIGRPFHHISHHFEYDNFFADIAQVCQSGDKLETEVTTNSGDRLIIQIVAYKNDNGLEQRGILVTLHNVTNLRNLENSLIEAQRHLDQKALSQLDD